MTPLEQIGLFLYGRFWQTELAEALNVSRRSVCRWVKGSHPIPISLWSELHQKVALKRETDAVTYDEIMNWLKDRV